MIRPKLLVRALLPFALHGLARTIDEQIGLLLHSSLELRMVPEVARLLTASAARTLAGMAAWTAAGLAVWLLLAFVRKRSNETSFSDAMTEEATSFAPLYVRPAFTLLGILSLSLKPLFPYAFTLPIALTQDWGIGQDALAIAWFLAARVPAVRWPAPRPGAVFALAFLVYALVTPERARWWDGHPGNEPKYLRQAVALGHELSLDAEGVSAAMEDLEPMPMGAALRRVAGTMLEETAQMGAAVFAGPSAVGADAIRASKITRQTVRGKDGGVYYVLAPGPSLLLAPTLRFDRAINRLRGTPGRLAVSVLAWNALGAALVTALFLLLRDATGRPGLAALLSAGFAFTPPFLFYFFQFYPEMVGALLLALALRALAFGKTQTIPAAVGLGLMLAALPWLHQKFLPIWSVLVVTALIVAIKRRAPRIAIGAFLVPQVVDLFLTALYNFAITGSIRPDALYLAWGPAGVTSARIGQGLLGLLLDARYGLVPYAPVYLLAGAGLLFAIRERSPLLMALPAAAVYYLTVASADNWAGAVCNLGRYFMPVAPLAIALVGIAVARVSGKRGAVAMVLVLAGWTAVFAIALWRDPLAANDSALLLARSAFADGDAYVPNLFIRHWSDAAPGLLARVLAWIVAAGGLALWSWRAAHASAGRSPARAVASLAAFALAGAFLLEWWPTGRTGPRFPAEVALGPDTAAFVSGPVVRRDDGLIASDGQIDVILRTPVAQPTVPILIGGNGVYRIAGGQPQTARPAGAWIAVPLEPALTVHDASGRTESLSRGQISVEGEVVLRFQETPGNTGRGGYVHE